MENIVIDNLMILALIKVVGNILTAAVPSVLAYCIGRKVVNERNLQNKLEVALSDIAFLLAVESFHCKEHQITQGKSNKITIRDSVKMETSLTWSGRNTMSRIDKFVESKVDKVNVSMDKPVRPARMYSRY